MDPARETVTKLLNSAGIEVNGDRPFDVRVHDPRFYQRVLARHSLGLGESYMDGWWDCKALDEFFHRILLARLDRQAARSPHLKWHYLKGRIFNLQSLKRARQVSEQHYDIGNDFYAAMLDKHMMYTCAYWKDARTLDEAQEAKMDLICRKLQLEPGMEVLELGCGWGGFARYAAEEYGAHVTAVNISDEQVKTACDWCRNLPVRVVHGDYRQVDGKYDRVVSIGIMEHVGYKNYPSYMTLVDERMKNDEGIALVHTIGGNVSTSSANAWLNKYIFPNGMLPSIAQLGSAMEGIFVMEDWHNIGPHYDKTLMAWNRNFEEAWPRFKDQYGERFYRMWRYYLLSCAGAFRARGIQLWQIVMTKPGRRQPDCRAS